MTAGARMTNNFPPVSFLAVEPSARRAKRCQELLRDIDGVVGSADGNAQEWQRGNFNDAIHVAVASDAVRPLMRGIVELDRDDWRQRPVANHEIDVLGFDVIEI